MKFAWPQHFRASIGSFADTSRLNRYKGYIPEWAHEWLDVIVPGLQIVMIVMLAMLLHHAVRRLLRRAVRRYRLPMELVMPIGGVARWLIVGGAFLMCLERLGVSATVLWAAFSSFAAVGAVAFFAVWSVLSNFFCALLIFTVRPFRIGDYIEIIDSGEKPGARGRVIDINMLFTTLLDVDAAEPNVQLQIPNTLIFQKMVRHWR
ncbi:MAG: mechanosensitive ion channel protein MscS, partial [Rhodoferax sp.]|nr:mechanosensitive ion channel protein MscS [Rhodoferax sp.]